MKLAIRRTYFGDRLCFPDVVPGRLVDVQAAYSWQLDARGAYRDDAIARAQREIPPELPALLRADPRLGTVRWIRDQVADGDGLPEECTWPADEVLLGPPVGHPATIWDMTSNYPRERSAPAPSPGLAADPPPLSSYLKAVGSLAGPYDDLVYPAISDRVAPEMELAIPTPSPTAPNGAPRSAPADGGATGIIASTSASGFTLQTWVGVDVTVYTSTSTKVSGGPAKELGAGTSVLVLGLVDAETSTTTITAAEIEIQQQGDGGAAAGEANGVLAPNPGAAGPSTSVGVIPSDYTQGSGTIVSGDQAYKAVEAAQAVYPGGVVDRVVQLSAGNYEVHNLAILWPHHVFVTTNYKVTGAND